MENVGRFSTSFFHNRVSFASGSEGPQVHLLGVVRVLISLKLRRGSWRSNTDDEEPVAQFPELPCEFIGTLTQSCAVLNFL